MPVYTKEDVKINYLELGSGEPLLLIQGLGVKMSGWYLQVPFFSDKMRVIAFDNRGVGSSSRPDFPYTMDDFVGDTKGLIDHLKIEEKIHLCGISMGGMIVQNFALKYPEMVKTLILIATTAKSPDAAPIIDAVRFLEGKDDLTKIWSTFTVYFSKTFRDRIGEDEKLFDYLKTDMLTNPTRPQDYINQASAIANTHDTRESLRKIRVPTLIIAAGEDLLLPPSHSKDLSEGIPHSRLEVIGGAGHAVTIEAADKLNGMIWDFIREHSDS